MANIKVSRREVEDYFRTQSDSLAVIKETVDISHLLVSPKAGEAAVNLARQKLIEIRNQLQAGADFGQLARQNSEDPASAQRGGEIGFVSRGDFVREFEEVAFALEPMQLSDVVLTNSVFI
jgi:peptidyl-prolyl cis-trans isomerase SurA